MKSKAMTAAQIDTLAQRLSETPIEPATSAKQAGDTFARLLGGRDWRRARGPWPCGSIVEARGRGSLRQIAKSSVETTQARGLQATENAKDSAVIRCCSWFVRIDS